MLRAKPIGCGKEVTGLSWWRTCQGQTVVLLQRSSVCQAHQPWDTKELHRVRDSLKCLGRQE